MRCDCCKECCICAHAPYCLAELGIDSYSPATKAQVQDRINKNQFSQHKYIMVEYLKRKKKEYDEYFIWLDDVREIPNYYKEKYGRKYRVARTASFAVFLLKYYASCENNIHISFDHDLGEKKTGYDVAKYIVKHQIPCTFSIHSMNPVGVENIRQLMTHYGYTEISDNYEK